jgi:hypothetical protein
MGELIQAKESGLMDANEFFVQVKKLYEKKSSS